MADLIALPDPERPGKAARLWINSARVATASALIERASERHRLFVESELQGLNRDDEDLEAARAGLTRQLSGD
jgi:hypothetical protein